MELENIRILKEMRNSVNRQSTVKLPILIRQCPLPSSSWKILSISGTQSDWTICLNH